jgi:hypothetical protein
MHFDVAPLDSYATRITSGVAYLGGILMLPLLFAYLSNQRWGGLLIPVAFAVVLALFLVLAYAAQPTAYIIEEQALVVRRRWWRRLRVPFKEISGVSVASTLADVPQRGLRFAFNPGIFGYQGPFFLAPYGQVFFLATSREHLVSLARQSATPLIISPARHRAFIDTMQQHLEAQSQPSSTPPRTEENGQQQNISLASTPHIRRRRDGCAAAVPRGGHSHL